MAPIHLAKRVRTYTDDGVDVIEATGQLRNNSRKRTKLSVASDDLSSPLSDSDADNRRDPPKELEIERSDEGDSDDGLDDAATQAVIRKFKDIKDNLPAENGIIEEVLCTNFMCHNKLRVRFGPLINFIIGHNGSGKSAVLTALTLCLGGRATATNRGQNLKSFIKEGQEVASLSVRIKNQGDNAYNQDIYGNSITIERQFSRSGTSGFKIKDASGKIVSTKRADLEDISDFYALQLDNPMNVLTQDMARQFLNSSTASEKYKFFIKGTQLEQLDYDYKMIEQALDEMQLKLAFQREAVRERKKEYKELQRKVQLAERQHSMRDKFRNLTRQMAWAQVEEQERFLEQIEVDIAKASNKISELVASAESFSAALDTATASYEESRLAVEELENMLEPCKEEYAKAKEEYDKTDEEQRSTLSQQRNIQQSLQSAKKNIDLIKKDLATERQRLADANGGVHAKMLDEIEESKIRAHDARVALEQFENGREPKEQKLKDCKRAIEAFKPNLDHKRGEVSQCESQLRSLTQDRGNWLRAYNRNLPNLLRAIDKEQGFKEKPVGPFGKHIRLLKPQWSSILEKSMGGILESFAVTSKHDQSILTGLMKRFECTAAIYVGSSAPINTNEHEPEDRLLTTIRALKIDNDLVRNQLIIHQGIEQTVLIPNLQEGMQFMFQSERPRNVKQCFCVHDTKRGWGTRLAYTPAGGQLSAPIQSWDRLPRLQSDIEEQINIAKDNLRSAKEESSNAEERRRELELQASEAEKEFNRFKRELHNMNVAQQQTEIRTEELQHHLEEQTPQGGKIEALERQLEEAENDKDLHSNSFQDAINELDKLRETLRKQEDLVATAQQEVDQRKAKIERATKKVEKSAERRHKALLEKNQAYELIKDAETDRNAHFQMRDAQAARITDFMEKASGISERVAVDPGETAVSLDRKLVKLDSDMKAFEQQIGGSTSEIKIRAEEAKERFEVARNQLDFLDQTAQSLKEAMQNRKERWKKFRHLISQRAKINFAILLSERNFRGKLVTNHEQRQLTMTVEPDITKSNAGGRQTQTLSGGEKSFATICLLLSLWEAMGSPIRCLDEFDVFMDNVNRDVSMKMMISAARQSVGRQFVLITPQAMSNIGTDDDVKIHRMRDPERGQTALPY